MSRSEYAQLVAIARREGRPLEEIGAAWREANTAVHGNPVAPETLERITRETKTGRLLSSGVPFREALRQAGAERNPRRETEAQRLEREAREAAELATFKASGFFRDMMRRRDEMADAGPYGGRRRRRVSRNPEPNPRAGSTDWGLVGMAAAGLGYLWWRQQHGASSPAPVSGLSAAAAVGPMQLPSVPTLIPYQAWWSKYINHGQGAPIGSQFPDVMVYDTPDGGMIGVPIPPPVS